MDRNLLEAGFENRAGALVRQGEWFFVPRPDVVVDEKKVLEFESIHSVGEPHICQFFYRIGGDVVYVNDANPKGLTYLEMLALPKQRRWSCNFRAMQRDAVIYVRGAVTHADHDSIVLNGWHQVVMNTETRAAAMSHVAFLD